MGGLPHHRYHITCIRFGCRRLAVGQSSLRLCRWGGFEHRMWSAYSGNPTSSRWISKCFSVSPHQRLRQLLITMMPWKGVWNISCHYTLVLGARSMEDTHTDINFPVPKILRLSLGVCFLSRQDEALESTTESGPSTHVLDRMSKYKTRTNWRRHCHQM
jgi:hypothetical protein